MLFSIIIPGFNCSETIYNAISSIVDQNYLDLEIIYCDDCSEDDSVNVVKRIANKNKSIKIFQSDKNRGPGYLRNTGTKLASGRFVIYLDADDWLEMGILGKLANVLHLTAQRRRAIREILTRISVMASTKRVTAWLRTSS